MAFVSAPTHAAYGVSTVPNTSIAALCIADAALEVNELDLEWSNVYDGDSYVCTKLRVAALSLIPTDILHSSGEGPGRQAGYFIQTVLSQSYNSQVPLRHVSRPNTEVKNSYLANDVPSSVPSSLRLDTAPFKKAIGIENNDAVDGARWDGRNNSVVCIPPSNFAILYKPSVMLGLKDPIPSVQHHIITGHSTSGVVVPGWAMFRPIEVELVSIDSNIGHNVSALRVVVNVYFNMSSVSSTLGSLYEPAYHKWSVSSHWVVGSKPRIVVNGRIMRRSMVAGPPSLWEWLPRTMPGLHLVQLDTSSDNDGRSTSYNAVYDLDYIVPLFTAIGGGGGCMSTQMATTAFSMAYYSIQESATTLVNGGVALETAFETQLQRMQTEAGYMSDMVGSIANMIQTMFAGAQDIASAASGGSGRERDIEIIGGVGRAASHGANIIREGVRQQALGVSRFATNKAYDLSALQRIGNSVERTVTIDVMGYPGMAVDGLQVAAFTIAKQVFFGWLTLGIPPKMKFGWLVRSVLNFAGATDFIKQLLTSGATISSAIAAAFQGVISNLLVRAAISLFNNAFIQSTFGVTSPFNWQLFTTVSVDTSNFANAWQQLMGQYITKLTDVSTYSNPRRFPGFIVQPGTDNMADALSPDDILSVLLAAMGIHTITSNVTVDHTIPLVRLTLTAVFKSVEYSGNTVLHSIWRAFSGAFAIPMVESGGGESMPSISTMIPAILPIATTNSYLAYRKNIQNAWWLNPEGPQVVLKSDDAMIGTFAHVFYDDRKFNDAARGNALLSAHQMRELLSHVQYAHGGSVGTGYVTPSIVPGYKRPNKENYYAAGLGAGVALWHLRATYSFPAAGALTPRHLNDLDGQALRSDLV